MSLLDQEDFTRTDRGTSAEAAMRGVSFILHIEGKYKSENMETVRDYIFYKNLTKSLGFSADIRLEGDCNSLMKESMRIGQSDSKEHIFIFDRDHNEVMGINKINSPCDFYTQGYSWENDFWTSSLLQTVVDVFCDDQDAIEACLSNFKEIENTAKEYHKLNILSRANGKKIFDMGGVCNMPITFSGGRCTFLQGCLTRLQSMWEDLDIQDSQKTISANSFLNNEYYNHPGYLIQGHSYEHLILEFIVKHSSNLKIVSSNNFCDKDMLCSIATRAFIKSPINMLNPSTINHYKSIFTSMAA
ncbi:hypothetical protein [Proteus terrae]|uniref:hypothetical protein n=1 Tax=Proteus terrae TaxID=1574161 RepID=UPI00301C641F